MVKKLRKRIKVKKPRIHKRLSPEMLERLRRMPILPNGKPNPLYMRPSVLGGGASSSPQGVDQEMRREYDRMSKLQTGISRADTSINAAKEHNKQLTEDLKQRESNKKELDDEAMKIQKT